MAGAAMALGFASMAGVASADVLTVGGGWDAFTFFTVGSPFATDFSFTLTGPAVFKVTDAYIDGDQFDISINGVDQGPTSAPVDDGTQIGNDYDAAFASPSYSHGSYLLGAGVYDVTGTVIQNATGYSSGGGAAELSLPSGVPEPAAWALMLAGFAGLGLALRKARRNRAASAAA
jgi:hypothetical protein